MPVTKKSIVSIMLVLALSPLFPASSLAQSTPFLSYDVIMTAYNARSAELWMIEPVEVKLADIGDHVLQLATNFVDGKRSYYDIYRAVRAEALANGEWYYGPVALPEVVQLLDAAVEAGALQLRQ